MTRSCLASHTRVVVAVTTATLGLQCASTPSNEIVEIRTVSGAARNITRMTQSTEDELHPTVAPDSKLVAFQVLKNGQYDIYALDTSTGVSRVQVTDHPGNDIDPSWLADSKTIVFSSNRLGSYSLWKQLASGGGGCTMITRGADMMDFAPTVSPAGGTVCFHSKGIGNASYVVASTGASEYAVFSRNLPHIWRVSLAGNELTQFGEGAYPAWAPDGTRVAFCSDTGGDWDIWMMDNDGAGMTQLAMPKDQLSPCFSHDGKWVAYVSDQGGNYDLWIMKTDGSSATQITADSSEEGMPSWGADGNIYFSSRKAGNWDIWKLTPVLPE